MHVKATPRFGQCLGLLAIGLTAAAVSPARASDDGMFAAEQVSLDSLYDFMDNWLYTHVGDDRGVGGAEHDLARDNIAWLMESYGLIVELEPFRYSHSTSYNVVGTLVGTTYPDQEYIIGAHYDSVGNPGADDNASGTAAVLEAARIISQYDSEYTIRFIGFTREEQGLVGSGAYVDDHWADDILGMISADMVAYDPDTDHARIYTHSASHPLRDALGAAIEEYGDGLTWEDSGWTGASNHAPFDSAGFQAGLLIEGEVWSNPYYHSSQDSFENPDNLNFPYHTKMTRCLVGWLVDQAGVIVEADYLKFDYPDDRPEYSYPSGGTTVRVVVSGMGEAVPQPGSALLHYNTGVGWEAVAMDMVEDNVYDAVLPGQTCGDEVLYYFSALTTTGEEYVHPGSAPSFTWSSIAAYGREAFFVETLDFSPLWSTTGLWEFGQPTGDGGAYGGPDPESGYTGTNVYGYNLAGDYENNMSEEYLTSSPINCSGAFDVHLSFWRWLGVERPLYDHAEVRVSTNGGDWTTIWENGSTISDTEWVYQEFDIADLVDGESTVRLRWTMGPTDSGWQYCGWNIDDISLTGLQCEPPFMIGDMNCDGAVDFFDIDPFVLAITDPAGYAGEYAECDILAGDCNDDGLVNFFDIEPFVELIVD